MNESGMRWLAIGVIGSKIKRKLLRTTISSDMALSWIVGRCLLDGRGEGWEGCMEKRRGGLL
jgi:hypothetical protein